MLSSVFSWNNHFSEEQINELLRQTAPTLLLSYARPIFGNLISNAGMPNLQIPFVDMTNNKVKIIN